MNHVKRIMQEAGAEWAKTFATQHVTNPDGTTRMRINVRPLRTAMPIFRRMLKEYDRAASRRIGPFLKWLVGR